MRIPITKSYITEDELLAVQEPLRSGWLVQGPKVNEFEKNFTAFTHANYAKAVSSCTVALELVLKAFGIGRGDKVILPSFTYIASANVIEHLGAVPVFCDIDLRTFNIDVNQLEQILEVESGIKAIMPVDLFGLCADMPQIMEIATTHRVKVVEDAACGFDSWIGDKHAGNFADAGCFSFHPRKCITTGEGGMIVTGLKDLHELISKLADHGADKSDFARHNDKGGSRLPDFKYAGYNFRMTDVQAAIGICQLRNAAAIMSKRRNVAAKYDAALKNSSLLTTPFVPDGYIHGYQSYVCLFSNGIDVGSLSLDEIDKLNYERNIFMDYLEEKGIATRQGTHAVHTLSYYKNKYKINVSDYIKSYAADRLSVSMPLYATMTDEEFNYVLNAIDNYK